MKTIILIPILLFLWLYSDSQVVYYDKILKGHAYTVLCLDADKTGKYIVSGSYDGNVMLWNYNSGEQLEIFKGNESGIKSVKISPDNRYAASGSWNNNLNAKGSSINCLNILDLKTFKLIKSLSVFPDRYKTLRYIPELDGSSANGIINISFNKDGSKIAALTSSRDLFIWNIKDDFNKTVYNLRDTQHKLLSLSPDWNFIACTQRKRTMVDTSFYLMGLGTNKIIARFDNPKRTVIGVYFSANSKYVASISGDRIKRNEIDIWDFHTQKLLFTLKGHSNVVRSIVFSKNDMYLASAGEDNLINLWDVQTGKLITSFTENNVMELTSVIFSPDQKYLISGSQDKTIKYWNIEKWINKN